MMMTIDLGILTQGEVRNISGHPRGQSARREFNLDKLDAIGERIVIHVPREIDAISPSFFQGLFAESVRHLGGEAGFFEHYAFDAPPTIIEQVIQGIRSSMKNRRADYLNQ